MKPIEKKIKGKGRKQLARNKCVHIQRVDTGGSRLGFVQLKDRRSKNRGQLQHNTLSSLLTLGFVDQETPTRFEFVFCMLLAIELILMNICKRIIKTANSRGQLRSLHVMFPLITPTRFCDSRPGTSTLLLSPLCGTILPATNPNSGKHLQEPYYRIAKTPEDNPEWLAREVPSSTHT